jgi:hypothetical protein
MVTVHKPRLLYDAISARLVAETSRPVGDGKRPPGASPPYYVIRSAPDELSDGPLADRDQIRHNNFLVFCVGNTRDAAQLLQEDAQEALLDWSPTVAGFSPQPIGLDLPNVRDSPDLDGPVYEIADRFSVFVS